ncbi:MAG: GumC family protein [Desulfobacteraceae bacterium]|nr:GumC family protein [Desulfobacteraceae bacterium]MBC2720478.1 GumC family protein [Desulfobacteraceae bacterium]
MEQSPEKNRILYHILYVIFRRKILLATICFISFVLIIFFTFLTTPTWEATTKIFIRAHPQQQLILFKDLATPVPKTSTVNPASNLVQMLISQEMAQEIVEKFMLDERLRKKTEEPEKLRDVIKQFLIGVITYPITLAKKIGILEDEPVNFFAGAVEELMEDAQDIELEEDTDVINLSIWEHSPGISSNIANHMAQLLIEKSTEFEQSNASSAHEFTRMQLTSAETALANAEAELLRFKEKNKIISFEEQKKAKLDELHMVETEFINVKTELVHTQAKLNEMGKEIAAQKKLLIESPMFANNSVMKDMVTVLNNAEIQLSGELEKYHESSKTVRTLRAQIAESKEKIEKDLKAIMQSENATLQSIHSDLPKEYVQLVVDAASLAARKDVLQKEIDRIKAEAVSFSVKEAELERFNRRVETNKKLYQNLLDKYSELEVQKASQMSGYDLKIIDKAFVPDDENPDWPKWILVIPLGFMGSLLLSFGAIFFIEYWNESFKSPNEIEERLALRVLCTVQDIK